LKSIYKENEDLRLKFQMAIQFIIENVTFKLLLISYFLSENKCHIIVWPFGILALNE